MHTPVVDTEFDPAGDDSLSSYKFHRSGNDSLYGISWVLTTSS
jgi:hypothetical protein